MMTCASPMVLELEALDLPLLGQIRYDRETCEYIARDDDGYPYWGQNERDVLAQYDDRMARLARDAMCRESGFTLEELRGFDRDKFKERARREEEQFAREGW